MEKIKNYFKKYINNYLIIQNINYDPSLEIEQKKVLIIYIDTPFKITNFENIYSSNILEMEVITKYFIENNYIIDIIYVKDFFNYSKIKNKKYDVIFGFGDIFYKVCRNNKDAVKILYLTENHPDFSYKEEKKRVDYFNKRKNKKAKITRSGSYYKEEQFLIADYFINMGKTSEIKKYDKPIFNIFPSALINKNFILKKKDFNKAKKEFLWFGSNGSIHKGLDILIDVFSKREDVILHICGLNNKDKKILKIKKRNNIINHGKINVKSDEFLKIVNKCAFLIHPSCSEATSTSVLTGMIHGLIPIIVKNSSSLDILEDKALFLEDYKIDYLESKINEFVKIDNEILEKKQYQIFNYSKNEFNLNNFKKNIYIIFFEILGDKYDKKI